MYSREELEQLRPLLKSLFELIDEDGDGKVDREALAVRGWFLVAYKMHVFWPMTAQFGLYVNGCVYESKKNLILNVVDANHPEGFFDLPTFSDIRTLALFNILELRLSADRHAILVLLWPPSPERASQQVDLRRVWTNVQAVSVLFRRKWWCRYSQSSI